MINTRKLKEPSSEEILKYISQEEIFRFYCGNFEYGKRIKSQIRDSNEDTDPSFVIYNNNGNLRFVDFGDGGSQGDIFTFVKIKFGLNFFDAIRKIDKDLGLNLYSGKFTINNDKLRVLNSKKEIQTHREEKSKKNISIIHRQWREYDIKYWLDYNITLETLNYFNVLPIMAYKINSYLFPADKYCYHYPVGSRDKIYQPFNPKKEFKFIGNTNKNSIQGFDKIDYTKPLLILTSSYKEVFVLYELGYNAIAPNSETSHIDKWIIDELKEDFNIIIMYDWDNAGIKQAKEQSELYGIDYIVFEEDYAKDLSDVSKEKGLVYLNNMINEKI